MTSPANASEARKHAASLPFATAEECDAKADAWLVVEDALREAGDEEDTRYVHQVADYWRKQAEMKRSAPATPQVVEQKKKKKSKRKKRNT